MSKSEQRLAARNQKTVSLHTMLVAANVAIAALRYFLLDSDMSRMSMIAMACNTVVPVIAVQQLSRAAKNGVDVHLSGGLCEYFQDLNFVGIAVAVGCLFSNWFLLLWLLVLGFVLVKLWGWVIGPWLKRWLEGEQQVQMSEAERRRLEKKQRKEDLQQRRYGNRR